MIDIPNILKRYNIKYCAIQDGEWSHILLAYPYNPYKGLGKEYAFIDAYYVASNTLYHITKNIKDDIMALGYELQDFHLSLKPLGEQCGLGKILNNRLLTNVEYGSKMTLQALSVKCQFQHIIAEQPNDYCPSCGLCDKSCPVGALSCGVFDRDKCLRNIQDFTDITSPFMANRIIGCQDCQQCCPHNANIIPIDMPDELKNLLFIDNLKAMAMGGKAGYLPLSKFIGSNYARAKYIKKILLL